MLLLTSSLDCLAILLGTTFFGTASPLFSTISKHAVVSVEVTLLDSTRATLADATVVDRRLPGQDT